MAQDKKISEIETIPFQGGMDTYHEPGLLPAGSFSSIQNMRQMHPGLKQRLGYIKKHSTADGTNGVMTMFQFSKGKRTERHFYAQMTDSDVLEATDAPPAVTTGVFGTEVFSGTASPIPASWSVLEDLCIFSNGVDQHQICAGNTNYVDKFIVYDSNNKLTYNPSDGTDYTTEVNDSNSSTVAVLDSLGNYNTCSSGTVSCTQGDTDFVGTSTKFLTELTVGQPVYVQSVAMPQYPTEHTADYVKTTTGGTSSYPYYATDPSHSLIGAGTGESTEAWRASTATNCRFHIDLGATKTITQIYYENYHYLGNNTNYGAKTFTFWGSNEASAFAELTYGTDTNWTPLTCSQATLDQHTAFDQTDPKYITVTNSTAYRYYAFKFADTWGGSTMGLRRVELYIASTPSEKNVIDTITSDTVATVKNAWGSAYSTKSFTVCNDCILACAPVMPNSITYTISKANGNTSVAYGSYYSTSGWKNIAITDNTISSAKSMAVTGSITWTQPTDAMPKYMYGINGFWVKIAFDSALDSEVEISSVTYGSGFTNIIDMWDGNLVDAVEAQFYDQSANTYSVYGTTAITLSSMTSSDELYFNSYDAIMAVYVDTGATNNTTTTTIDHLEYLNSAGVWTSVGSYTDETYGFSKSGFISFNPISGITQTRFNGSTYNSYWFRLGVSSTMDSSVVVGIQTIPYFNVSDYGIGLCNVSWGNRVVYVFDQDPSYLYISADSQPQVLSSDDSAIYQAGDGRSNKIVCMKPYYQNLLVAQEEKGSSGGCVTLITGTTPATLGKINISNYYGAMNSQCMEVVEALGGGHRAFILSKKGILQITTTDATNDSRSIQFVPNFDKIMNYFDPTDSDCIRVGYESKHYIKYDSTYNILKIGLTTGSSATNNNIFLVYDLLSNDFLSDAYANNFACEVECDAASGNVPTVRLAGGQADGTVYILNSGLNDVSTAVDASAILELNNRGKIIRDAEMIIRAKTQSAGDMTLTPYRNGVAISGATKTLTLTAERTNDRIRRHRVPLNFVDQNVSVKLSHNTVSESFYLLDYGVNIEEYSEQ